MKQPYAGAMVIAKRGELKSPSVIDLYVHYPRIGAMTQLPERKII
jgi:dihydroorotase-like cyclic amidohydrolase